MEKAADAIERSSTEPRNVTTTGPVYTSPAGLLGGSNGRALRECVGVE